MRNYQVTVSILDTATKQTLYAYADANDGGSALAGAMAEAVKIMSTNQCLNVAAHSCYTKGTLGNPTYHRGDLVTFRMTLEGEVQQLYGTIEIVDAYGTFEQNEEPSYDIMVNNLEGTTTPCLVKHIRESAIEDWADGE